MKWSDIEITGNDDKPVQRNKVAAFVKTNCPGLSIGPIPNLTTSICLNPGKPDQDVSGKGIRDALLRCLRGKAKKLKIVSGPNKDAGTDIPAPIVFAPVQAARVAPNVHNVNPALLQMHLDVDRDGNIDNIPANHNEWAWGVGGHGAVISVKTREYAANMTVAERQPVEFRWEQNPRPVNWQATLTADHPNLIRVYRQQSEGAAMINLPCDISTLGPEDAPGIYRLWIEAVDYPSTRPEADWLVKLDFKFSFGGAERNHQEAVVRIAPWIMVSDLDKTRKIYIVDFGVSNNIKNGVIKVDNTTIRNEVAHSCPGGTTLVPVTAGLQGLGRYLRDAMRFGTHVVPAQNQPAVTPVVMRGNNPGTQHDVPRNGIDRVNDGIGYITKGDYAESDLQTGGNMMVSPPVAGYPWGRIICGSGADKGGLGPWEAFLKAQRVQRPILIDTDWLSVGHSDEIVAFVPKVAGSGAGGKNFRMLVTSPRQGYRLLEQSGIDWNAVEFARNNHDLSYVQHQQNVYNHIYPPIVDMRQYILANLNYVGDNGEGRMGFGRFGNDNRPLHFWLDDFLASDELITRVQGGDVLLRNAHLTELQLWFNSLTVPLPGSFAHGQLQQAVASYANTGFAALAQNFKNVLKNRLRTEITQLQTSGALSVADTRRLGLFLLCDHPDIRNLREAKVLLTSINDPIALQFPTAASYLTACTQVWNLAQPVIDQLVLNAQINTDQPSTDQIYAALQTHFALNGIPAQEWTTLRSTLRDNLILQAKLSAIFKTIGTELEIDPADIIEVPILYTNAAGAKTHVADMVNFLMLNTPGATVNDEAGACTCLVPKPYGPIVNGVDIYEEFFHQQLTALGITVTFIDEWYEYHLNDGEIHCGTNQLPDISDPAARKTWWQHPAPPV